MKTNSIALTVAGLAILTALATPAEAHTNPGYVPSPYPGGAPSVGYIPIPQSSVPAYQPIPSVSPILPTPPIPQIGSPYIYNPTYSPTYNSSNYIR